MAEKENTQSIAAETVPTVDYAFWDVLGESQKVVYSLPLFHEIDFVVNEGYRKIPHGGIEVAGLLFGTIGDGMVRIEAFREIACEHASGPSLNFSQRDLAELEKQIANSASDPELAKLVPVGWFLAHTRGPMELTEAEATQFDQFFPKPSQVAVLIKPERFQPTRFGFLVRSNAGKMLRDAVATAIILPLPGRSHKPGHLIASLPAPAPSSSAKRALGRVEKEEKRPAKVRAPDFDDELEDDVPPAPKLEDARKASEKVSEPAPLSIWKVPPDPDIEQENGFAATPEPETQTPAEKAARRQLSRDRARIIEQAFPAPPPSPPFRPAALPSLPANAAIPVPTAYDRYPRTLSDYPVPSTVAAESVLNPRAVTALALAALLGCLVGYIAYLQLPAPVIPIDVRPVNQMIVVSWPPDETRNSIYAAIRLNDGPPVPLSADEKRSGQVSLTATKEFKVEVLARNWIRDSRGIVRYLHSANGNGQVVPADTPPRP